MKKFYPSLFRPLAVCVAVIFIAGAVFGQDKAEQLGQSYDLVVHLVESGVRGDSDNLPDGWKQIEKQLPSNVTKDGFKNVGVFRLRGNSGGSLTYEGVWPFDNGNENIVDTVVRMYVHGLMDQGGKVRARAFELNIFLPAGMSKLPVGVPSPERLCKFTSGGISFEPNVPTMLTSFSLGDPHKTLFVVLTVRPARG